MTRKTSLPHGISEAPTIAPRPQGRYDRYRVLVCNLADVVARGPEPADQARGTLERVRARGIRVELMSGPAALASLELDAAETLVVTGTLEDAAAARDLGLDSLFLLGRANGLLDVSMSGAAARPTYVAMDIRTLEHPPSSGRPSGEAPARLSWRGEVTLRRPFRASPQEVLDAAVEAVHRARDRNSLILTGRADLWRPVELELRDYWNRWLDRQVGVIGSPS